MATIYTDKGEAIPVTVLRYETWKVSQIKTTAKDGYTAIQIASMPKKAKNSSAAAAGHVKAAGFETGARFLREIRQDIPADLKVGDTVLYGKYAGTEIQVDGKDLLIMRESDIYAII